MSDNMDMPVNSNANDVAEAHGIGISAAALQTRGRARQEVGIVIQEELAIAGVTESSFAALREEADALSTLEPKSDADIAALQKVITKGTRLCTTISEAIEPGKKWAHALHKAYTSNENEFIGTVKAIIEPLKAKKGTYVARKEQEEREALEARERLIRARFTALEGFGFTRRTAMAGGEDLYINGETTIAVAYVTEADDTVWGNVLKGIEIAWNEEQERKAQEAEAAAQEAERIRLAQEDIERKQRELKEQQDAFNAKINEARKNELLALGCELDANGDAFVFIPKHVSPLCPDVSSRTTWITADLHLADPWQQQLDDATKQVGIRDARIKENEEFVARKALIASRVKALKEAGWQDQTEGVLVLNMQEGDGVTMTASVFTQEVSHLGDMPDDVFLSRLKDGNLELARRKTRQEEAVRQSAIESERQRVAMQAKLDEQARAERQARMGDVEKIEKWMSDFTENAPALASAIGKSGVASLVKSVTNAGKKMIQDIQA